MPEAVWYIRPPSGGQFGPAEAELMRTWLEEGRITGDSWVWREDWKDWARASYVFAGLPATPEETGPGAATVGPPAELTEEVEPSKQAPTIGPPPTAAVGLEETGPEIIPPIDVQTEPSRPKAPVERRGRRRSAGLVVGLSVVVVLLGIILIWVLSRS
jgi:hypothetical protein